MCFFTFIAAQNSERDLQINSSSIFSLIWSETFVMLNRSSAAPSNVKLNLLLSLRIQRNVKGD